MARRRLCAGVRFGLMGLLISRASGADSAALLALIHEHAHFEQGVATITEGELAGLVAMRRPPVRIFVAASADHVIAYAALTSDYALWRARRWAHLDCLFVSPKARGAGVGAQLFCHVQHIARRLGADRLEWQTPDWNKRGIAFYNREGATGLPKMRFSLSLN